LEPKRNSSSDRRQIAAASWEVGGRAAAQAYSSLRLAKISRCSRPPFLWLRPSPTPRNPSPDIRVANSCGLAASTSSFGFWMEQCVAIGEGKDPVLRGATPARTLHTQGSVAVGHSRRRLWLQIFT
jgi:hypothetical protein